MTRHRPSDEDAVSSVLGAILVFALLVVTLVVIQTQFAPIWEEDREARHVDVVVSQLGQVVADLGRLGSNQTSAQLTDPFTLTRAGVFSFFGASGSAGGALDFAPDETSGIALSSPLLRVQSRNGVNLYGLDSTWSNYAAVPSQSNVTEVSFLRLRALNVSDPGTQNVYTAMLDIRAGATSQGTLKLIFDRQSSETFVKVLVQNATGAVLYDGGESFFHNSPIENFYIDALGPEYLFNALLAQAPTPYDIVFTTDAPVGIFDAQFQFAGTQQTGGGTIVVGNAGVPIANYNASVASGVLRLNLNNQHLPAQTYVLEHGAVLVIQDGAAVMRIPPALRFAVAGPQTQISWTLPGLVGQGTGVSGSDSASVSLSPAGGRTDLTGTAATFSFTIPTSQPAAWASWLEGQLRGAGLAQALGHYTLSQGSGTVTVTLSGASSDANVEDVVVALQLGNVLLTTRASG